LRILTLEAGSMFLAATPTGRPVVGRGIACGVDPLVDGRVTADQVHDARLLAGPQVFPAAAQRALAAREELQKCSLNSG
jgi:hypothetical protein